MPTRRPPTHILGVVLVLALAAPAHGATASDRDDPLPRVPPGFAVTPYATVGGTPTSLAFGPGGEYGAAEHRLYVADFVGDRVLAFDDLGGVAAGPPTVFADELGGPLGVTVAEDGTVFVADSTGTRPGPFGNRNYGRVWRMRDTDGDGVADERSVVLKDLPNGRHNTNGMALGPDGRLYVTNGNSTDDGVLGGAPEVLPWSGSVVRVDPDATEVSIADADPEEALVAHGMRNLYDVAFSPVDPTKLFIPTNGADDAGGDATPGLEDSDDLLYATDVADTREAAGPSSEPAEEPVIDDFGFPSCFYNERRQANLRPYDNPNPAVIDRFGPCPTETVPRPVASFGLHVSADGLAFQDSDAWGEDFRDDLFVAEFGNFFGEEVVGHRVVRVELDTSGTNVVRQSEFLSGALPLDVTFHGGDLYVADFGGAIYRVTKVADVPGVVDVQMNGFQFLPPAITVPEGTTVRWTNREALGLHHQVTGQLAVRSDGSQDAGSEINSAPLDVGEGHEFRFETPGTYVYTCTIDPVHQALMHGTITVVPTGN